MNKSRNKKTKFSLLEIMMLTVALITVMVAGVTHAWLRNCSVQVMRDVDKMQQKIEDHEDKVNSLQVKIDKKLNIYQLRDDLERTGSELVVIPTGLIEKVSPNQFDGLASVQIDDPTIAQITP